MQELLDLQIRSKVQYLNDLKSERIVRPDTKVGYIALLEQTEQEITQLIVQNDVIIAANVAEVEAARQAAIEAATNQPVLPSLEERLAAVEMALLEVAGV